MNRFVLLLSLSFLCYGAAFAQYPTENPDEDIIRTTNFVKMKPLLMTPIPGAPVLSQPIQINGDEMEIRTVKHGLCYPAIYDWNHDGKSDLLLGEFSTGKTDNNIKVLINEGSKKKPRFSGRYFYATDTRDSLISNYQWCCIGIHPRLVDITGDGLPDMLSGQYNPGMISLWEGSKDGFLPSRAIEQEGYHEGNGQGQDPYNPNSGNYWNYTSAGFGDFNGDGLQDLFVGGNGGMRVAFNEGTASEPKFGLRQPLLYVDGTHLATAPEKFRNSIYKTYMTPVDWDGDGVLDLLVTDNYTRRECMAVSFFRGVMTDKGLRFEKPLPLFTTADGSKELPGCQPMITVGDLNGDGVNDLVLGISIPTYDGYVCADSVAWQWISDTGIQMPGKDSGEFYMYTTLEALRERVKQEVEARYYLGNLKDTKYLTLRHRGYVFVMYGKANKQKAIARHDVIAEDSDKRTTERFEGDADSPVTYQITHSAEKENGQVDVILDIAKGWHAYVELDDPDKMEFIPTRIEVELPKGCTPMGLVEKPYTKGIMYTGRTVFSQHYFAYGEEADALRATGKLPVKVKISYQVCNDDMCIPPVEHVIERIFEFK